MLALSPEIVRDASFVPEARAVPNGHSTSYLSPPDFVQFRVAAL